MASTRPRPQVIRLTEAAADRIKYVMANAANPVVGVRVGVKNGGCAGMAYTMEYAERWRLLTRWWKTRACACSSIPRPCCSCSGPRWTTRPKSFRRKFVFNNPNQTSACGCGESVELKPAVEAQ